jgi:glycosyltransferase involved in cell wall biosynthesis
MAMNSLLRVLMIVGHYPPFIGGAGVQCKKLAEALSHEERVSVDVLAIRRKVKNRHPRIQYKNKVHWIPLVGIPWGAEMRGSTVFSMFYIFMYIILFGRKYDVIHIHQAQEPAVAAICAARLIRKKTVVKISNSMNLFDLKVMRAKIFGALQVAIIGKADVFIALTTTMRRDLVNWGIKQDKIIDIPNTTDIMTMDAEPLSELKNAGNVLIFIGAFTKKKNLVFLIDVVSELHVRGNRFTLALVGDGPCKQELIGRAKVRGIENEVLLYEAVSDVLPYVKAADIFVLPSKDEGLSNSLLEALSCGVPAVVSDTVFNREIRELFPAAMTLAATDDINDWTEKIKALKEHLPSQEELRLKIENALFYFSLREVAGKYVNLYHRLLNEGN